MDCLILARREVGPRHERTQHAELTVVEESDTVRLELLAAGVSDVQRPSLGSPGCFWNARVPAAVRFDVASDAKVAELVRQSLIGPAWLNMRRYTANVTLVDGATPRVPVYAAGGRFAGKAWLASILQAGVPIPDGFSPTADSDSHGVFYWPAYVGPTGRRGLLFECWAMKAVSPEETLPLAPDGSRYRFKCYDGGRVNGTEQNTGRYGDWDFGYKGSDPTHADSTFISSSWSPTGSGLPLAHGILTVEDIRRGRCDHGLGLIYAGCVPGSSRWPAKRTDGTWAGNPLWEGDRFSFPADYVPPAGLHPVTRIIAQAGIEYGYTGLDVSGGACLAMRAEPGVLDYVGEGEALADFPWGDLRCHATGSDSMPNPV